MGHTWSNLIKMGKKSKSNTQYLSLEDVYRDIFCYSTLTYLLLETYNSITMCFELVVQSYNSPKELYFELL